jgi:hypothetical protein
MYVLLIYQVTSTRELTDIQGTVAAELGAYCRWKYVWGGQGTGK